MSNYHDGKSKSFEYIHQLSDSEEDVRAEAARRLNWVVIEQAFFPLVEALRNDPNKNVRMYAAGAFGKLKDKGAIEPLTKALNDREPIVRHWAANALGVIGHGHAVSPLLTALKDKEAMVRWAAAWSLGEIGDARALEALINARNDKHPTVRANANEAIQSIKGRSKK